MKYSIKYRPAGRPSAEISKRLKSIKREFTKLGIEGRYEYSSIEELEDIYESARRSHLKKHPELIENDPVQEFEKGGIVEQPKEKTLSMSQETTATETTPVAQFNFGDHSGLTEDTVSRDYSDIPVNQFTGQDVEEPQIAHNIEHILQRGNEGWGDANGQPETNQGGSGEEETTKSFFDAGNPAMEQMDDRDKTFASEQLVDAILDGYDALHDVGKNLASYNENKLSELEKNGDIDPNVEIVIGGEQITFREYAQEHNKQIEQVLAHDKVAFAKKVRQPMIRIFKKKNWGISDEQLVLAAFVQDAGMKTAGVIQVMQTSKMVLSTLREYTAELKKSNSSEEVISPTSISKPIKED